MKTYFTLLIIFFCIFSFSSTNIFANWNKQINANLNVNFDSGYRQPNQNIPATDPRDKKGIPQFYDEQLKNFLDDKGNPLTGKIIQKAQDDSLTPDSFQEYPQYGEAANDNYGYSVSSAGDVNAEGFDDFI